MIPAPPIIATKELVDQVERLFGDDGKPMQPRTPTDIVSLSECSTCEPCDQPPEKKLRKFQFLTCRFGTDCAFKKTCHYAHSEDGEQKTFPPICFRGANCGGKTCRYLHLESTKFGYFRELDAQKATEYSEELDRLAASRRRPPTPPPQPQPPQRLTEEEMVAEAIRLSLEEEEYRKAFEKACQIEAPPAEAPPAPAPLKAQSSFAGRECSCCFEPLAGQFAATACCHIAKLCMECASKMSTCPFCDTPDLKTFPVFL
jgi:hypothetical protein